MIRISTIFVAICMVLVAASLGMILYALLGINAPNSAIVALAALTFLILLNAISTRSRDRTDTSGQIADLSRGTADLARQIAEFGRRLAVVETRVASSYSVSQDRIQSVQGEISELGSLVKQLAGSVASHDDALSTGWSATASALAPQPVSIPAQPPQFLADDATMARRDTPLLTAIRHAIEANRIDIYLQPMVTLPQRKVRFYEAVSRLRGENDQVLAAGEFIDSAETAGLMGQIDHAVMLRCMQVLRRLMVRNKDVGVFCNMAATTLANPDSFAPCLDFLEANRALAASFVIEFKQSTFRSLGPIENEHLAALAQRGFRFSIDNVADLRIDPRDLAERGVRYIKVPAAMLLDQRRAATADIAAADLSDLLGRFGIDLIAERIEGERDVVDLLDYDVRFGQGFLFAAPRPLRPEAVSATETSPSPEPAREATLQEPHAPAAPSLIPPRPDAARTEPSRVTGNAALARRALGPN